MANTRGGSSSHRRRSAARRNQKATTNPKTTAEVRSVVVGKGGDTSYSCGSDGQANSSLDTPNDDALKEQSSPAKSGSAETITFTTPTPSNDPLSAEAASNQLPSSETTSREAAATNETAFGKTPPIAVRSTDVAPGVRDPYTAARSNTSPDGSALLEPCVPCVRAAEGENSGETSPNEALHIEKASSEDYPTQSPSTKRRRETSLADERDIKRFVGDWFTAAEAAADSSKLNCSGRAHDDETDDENAPLGVNHAIASSLPFVHSCNDEGSEKTTRSTVGCASANSAMTTNTCTKPAESPTKSTNPKNYVWFHSNTETSTSGTSPHDAGHQSRPSSESANLWLGSPHRSMVRESACHPTVDAPQELHYDVNTTVLIGRQVVDRRLTLVSSWWECQFHLGVGAGFCGSRWGSMDDVVAHYSMVHFPVVVSQMAPAWMDPLSPWLSNLSTCGMCGAASRDHTGTCSSWASSSSSIASSPTDAVSSASSCCHVFSQSCAEQRLYGRPVEDTAWLGAAMSAAIDAAGELEGPELGSIVGGAGMGESSEEDASQHMQHQMMMPWTSELAVESGPAAGQAGQYQGSHQQDGHQEDASASAQQEPWQNASDDHQNLLLYQPWSYDASACAHDSHANSFNTIADSENPTSSRHADGGNGSSSLSAEAMQVPAFGHVGNGFNQTANDPEVENFGGHCRPAPSASFTCCQTVCPKDLQL